jgi:hypothetical protein
MITGYNPLFHPELPWFRGPPPRLGCLACHGIPGRSLPSRGVIGVIQHGKNRQFSSNEKLYTYIYIYTYVYRYTDMWHRIVYILVWRRWREGYICIYIYTYTCICYRYVVILKFWSRLWISQSHYHFDSLLFDISTFFLLQHDCLCTYIYIYICLWIAHTGREGFTLLNMATRHYKRTRTIGPTNRANAIFEDWSSIRQLVCLTNKRGYRTTQDSDATSHPWELWTATMRVLAKNKLRIFPDWFNSKSRL